MPTSTDPRTPAWIALVADSRRELALAEAERIAQDYRERQATAALSALLEHHPPESTTLPPLRTPAEAAALRRGKRLAAFVEAHAEHLAPVLWALVADRVGDLVGQVLARQLAPAAPPVAPTAVPAPPDPGDGDPLADPDAWKQEAPAYEQGDAWEPPLQAKAEVPA